MEKFNIEGKSAQISRESEVSQDRPMPILQPEQPLSKSNVLNPSTPLKDKPWIPRMLFTDDKPKSSDQSTSEESSDEQSQNSVETSEKDISDDLSSDNTSENQTVSPNRMDNLDKCVVLPPFSSIGNPWISLNKRNYNANPAFASHSNSRLSTDIPRISTVPASCKPVINNPWKSQERNLGLRSHSVFENLERRETVHKENKKIEVNIACGKSISNEQLVSVKSEDTAENAIDYSQCLPNIVKPSNTEKSDAQLIGSDETTSDVRHRTEIKQKSGQTICELFANTHRAFQEDWKNLREQLSSSNDVTSDEVIRISTLCESQVNLMKTLKDSLLKEQSPSTEKNN